jgi:transposase
MMGHVPKTDALFYYFRLEDQIPQHHLLRLINRYVDFAFVHQRLACFYKEGGRPSVDPEVLMRMLLLGYLYGIGSDRKLAEEVRLNLAYRWFTGLGLDHDVPDHSTFSKNRHDRFRESGIFREIFEEIVRRCIQEGLVEGKHLSVDGTVIQADAQGKCRKAPKELEQIAKPSWSLKEYLAELEKQDPKSSSGDDASASNETSLNEDKEAKTVSTTDPDAAWCGKYGPAHWAYYDNYLIDNPSRVIVGVEGTAALFSQEAVAAQKMLEDLPRLGLHPESLGADKAYGSGEFLAWLLNRKIAPHIPVIDHHHQTQGRFTKDRFQYDASTNSFTCPNGQTLSYRGLNRQAQMYVYSSRPSQCQGCPLKAQCITGPSRKVTMHWYEDARQAARALKGTPAYEQSRKTRYRVEVLYSELKNRIELRKVRLRRLWNVAEQFLLAATVQNIKRLVKFLNLKQPTLAPNTA